MQRTAVLKNANQERNGKKNDIKTSHIFNSHVIFGNECGSHEIELHKEGTEMMMIFALVFGVVDVDSCTI